jgi:hypothetical protein
MQSSKNTHPRVTRKPSTENARRGYTVREFADSHRIGVTSVYQEIKAGRLKTRKVGRRTIIATEDAEEWFSACAGT